MRRFAPRPPGSLFRDRPDLFALDLVLLTLAALLVVAPVLA